MILRSHKQLSNVGRNPQRDKNNVSVRERPTKLKKNKEKLSPLDGQKECNDVSRSFNGKMITHNENTSQTNDFKNKHEQRIAEGEEKENKNYNFNPATKCLRKIPQLILHDMVVKTDDMNLMVCLFFVNLCTKVIIIYKALFKVYNFKFISIQFIN